jgi:hypothetical protein
LETLVVGNVTDDILEKYEKRECGILNRECDRKDMEEKHIEWEKRDSETRSRHSLVGIATGYGLDDRRFGVLGVLHVVQTGSGAHPSSYQMGTGECFPGGKAAGA